MGFVTEKFKIKENLTKVKSHRKIWFLSAIKWQNNNKLSKKTINANWTKRTDYEKKTRWNQQCTSSGKCSKAKVQWSKEKVKSQRKNVEQKWKRERKKGILNGNNMGEQT